MKQSLELLAFVLVILLGSSFVPESASADDCAIAVTTSLESTILVTIPDSVFDHEIMFRGSRNHRQIPLVADGDCPKDRELLFSVHDCTNGYIYEFKTLPRGSYRKDDDIPLYTIGDPLDDDFDGDEIRKRC